MMLRVTLYTAGLVLGFATLAPLWAADAILQLAPGGSFVIKDASGEQSLLIVDSEGHLTVNGQSVDFAPPSIESDLPEIATGQNMDYTITLTDDVGLVSYSTQGGQWNQLFERLIPDTPGSGAFPASIAVQLYGREEFDIHVYAADTSGNAATKTFTVKLPYVGMKIGRYRLLGDNTLPEGFDCSEVTSPWDPEYRYFLSGPDGGYDLKEVNELSVLEVSSGWSQAEGYSPRVQFNVPQAETNYSFRYAPPNPDESSPWSPPGRVSLDATVIAMDSINSTGGGVDTTYELGFEGEVRVLNEDDPRRLELDLNMKCKIAAPEDFEDAAWIQGESVTFTAEFEQGLYTP